MKITRLRRGYKIRLTDHEFKCLTHLVHDGKAELCNYGLEELKRLRMPERFGEFKMMRVDEDRRSVPVAEMVDAQR